MNVYKCFYDSSCPMDVSNCLYDPAEEISLPEFHRKYPKTLPMLVVVLGGYDGTTEYDDTPSDTVSYLYC